MALLARDFIEEQFESTLAAGCGFLATGVLLIGASGLVAPQALPIALLAVALPVGLLTWARTSGADFAESEDVGVNRLGSATLDVEVGPSRAALGARNMAPGDVFVMKTPGGGGFGAADTQSKVAAE